MENVSQQQQGGDVQDQLSTFGQTPYIGFWPRFAAFSIDSVITTLASMAIFIPIGLVVGTGGSEITTSAVVLQLLGYCVVPAYFIYFTYTSQATLGKQFIGIKILSQDGYKLSLSKIVLRETIGRIVNMFTAYLSYIIVAFTGKKQGLHDMIANSVVVRIDPSRKISKKRVAFGIFIGMLPLLLVVVVVGIIFSIGIYAMPGNFSL